MDSWEVDFAVSKTGITENLRKGRVTGFKKKEMKRREPEERSKNKDEFLGSLRVEWICTKNNNKHWLILSRQFHTKLQMKFTSRS